MKIPALVSDRLNEKVSTTVLELLKDNQRWEKYAGEIQQAIDLFNHIRQDGHPDLKTLENAAHLMSILGADLPGYTEIIAKLEDTPELSRNVFDELAESDYFQEVWEIDNPNYAMINLMILFYRTSLLNLFPVLREESAQISSALEEMAAVLYLEGQPTNLFSATRKWIENWKVEGFSKQLWDKLSISLATS